MIGGGAPFVIEYNRKCVPGWFETVHRRTVNQPSFSRVWIKTTTEEVYGLLTVLPSDARVASAQDAHLLRSHHGRSGGGGILCHARTLSELKARFRRDGLTEGRVRGRWYLKTRVAADATLLMDFSYAAYRVIEK